MQTTFCLAEWLCQMTSNYQQYCWNMNWNSRYSVRYHSRKPCLYQQQGCRATPSYPLSTNISCMHVMSDTRAAFVSNKKTTKLRLATQTASKMHDSCKMRVVSGSLYRYTIELRLGTTNVRNTSPSVTEWYCCVVYASTSPKFKSI